MTKRYILVDEPYYSSGAIRRIDYVGVTRPGIGDVVTTDEDFVDRDGDRLVRFDNELMYINGGILVDVEDVIRERTTAPTGEAAGEPIIGQTFDENRTARPVTLAAKVIRPTVIAELLTDIGLDDTTTEELVALAVLRSADDGIPFPGLARLSALSRVA
jgi:hypothetical protein